MKKNRCNFVIISILLVMVLLIFSAPSWATASVASPPLAAEAGSLQEGAPPFNLLEFLKTAGPIFTPLLAIVFGVVDYLGKVGVKGTWQLISSLLTGLALGGLVMYFMTYPATPVAWFAVALFGLLVGLAASGCYNGIVKATTKGSSRSLGLPDDRGKG